MKILRFITRLNVGGPSIQAISLTDELIKNGYKTKLVIGECVDEDSMESDAKNIKDHLIKINNLKREINFKNDFFVFLKIRKLIKKYKPDIIHTHMSKAGFLARFAAISIFFNRPKLIHTFHGNVFNGYFGKIKTMLFIMIEQFLAKRTDVLIAISKTQSKELKKYLNIDFDKIKIVPLGFKLDKFLSIIKKDLSKKIDIKVGIIGRIAKIKNHDFFVELINALNKYSERFNFYGYVYGGNKDFNDSMIKSCGVVEHKYIDSVYNFLDIVACTSINEGTPVAIIEAMASNRLVITNRIGGCVDLIENDDGYSGLYIGNDLRSFARLLEYVIETNIYEKYLKKAKKYVVKNHSFNKLFDNLYNIYSGVLDD